MSNPFEDIRDDINNKIFNTYADFNGIRSYSTTLLPSFFATEELVFPLTKIFSVTGGSLLPIGEYVIGVKNTLNYNAYQLWGDDIYYALNVNTGATHYICNKYDLFSVAQKTIVDAEYPGLNYNFDTFTNTFFAIIGNKLVISINKATGVQNSVVIVLNSLSKTGVAFNNLYNAYSVSTYAVSQLPTYNYPTNYIQYSVGIINNQRETFASDFGIFLNINLWRTYPNDYEKQLVVSLEIDGVRLLHTQNNVIGTVYSNNVLNHYGYIPDLNNKNIIYIPVYDYPTSKLFTAVLTVTSTTSTFNFLSSVNGSSLTPSVSGTFHLEASEFRVLDNGYVVGRFIPDTYTPGFNPYTKVYKCQVSSSGTISNISLLVQTQNAMVGSNFAYDWGTTVPSKSNLYNNVFIDIVGTDPNYTINYINIDSNKYYQVGSLIPNLAYSYNINIKFLGANMANKAIVIAAYYDSLALPNYKYSTKIHQLDKP